eukprot:CAMPEP_0185725706 /NCGR_PEP_ID=MMETSP1171-20130828/1902_1 /TAXON_ID=374046 /ORGANISM="Helicotheca tamensis, Strain CCMP826" /LENGTH=149 /DNA_ID=CAMNT_0028393899 /DNA_START=61 /DNA_END=510 /DNA_ORIENTATION=-
MERNSNQTEISDVQVTAAPPTTTICEEQQTTKAPGMNYSKMAPMLVSTPTYTKPPGSGGYIAPMIPGTATGTYEPPRELQQRTTITTLVSIAPSSDDSSKPNLRRSGDQLDNPVVFGCIMLILFLWSLFWVFWANNNISHYIDHYKRSV